MKRHWLKRILVFAVLHCSYLNAQVPIGSDLIGPQTNCQLGYAVDMSEDGNRVVVSTPLYTSNILYEGFAQVFELIDGNWTQMGSDIYGLSAYEFSGNAVAMNADGTIIVIGSNRGSINSTHEGHTRVFRWNGSNWEQMGDTIFGEFYQNYSGSSVSINDEGNIIAINSPNNGNNGTLAGQVRIYKWTNDSEWVQMGSDLLGDVEYDHFGYHLSLNKEGNRIVASSGGNESPFESAGQLKVFEWSGTEWIQLGEDIYGPSENFQLGTSLDFNDEGTKIVASAVNGFSTSTGQWHVLSFEWDGTQWQQYGNNIIADEIGDNFGFALSLDGAGNRLALGAYLNDANGSDSGLVRIYDYVGNDWVQYGTDIFGDSSWDIYGYSVSLNNEGTRMAVGARGFNGGDGMVRNYDLTILGTADIDSFNNLLLYPNPVNDLLTVFYEEPIDNISIVSILGQELYNANVDALNTVIDLSAYTNGVYFVQLQIGDHTISKKLIKE